MPQGCPWGLDSSCPLGNPRTRPSLRSPWCLVGKGWGRPRQGKGRCAPPGRRCRKSCQAGSTRQSHRPRAPQLGQRMRSPLGTPCRWWLSQRSSCQPCSAQGALTWRGKPSQPGSLCKWWQPALQHTGQQCRQSLALARWCCHTQTRQGTRRTRRRWQTRSSLWGTAQALCWGPGTHCQWGTRHMRCGRQWRWTANCTCPGGTLSAALQRSDMRSRWDTPSTQCSLLGSNAQQRRPLVRRPGQCRQTPRGTLCSWLPGQRLGTCPRGMAEAALRGRGRRTPPHSRHTPARPCQSAT